MHDHSLTHRGSGPRRAALPMLGLLALGLCALASATARAHGADAPPADLLKLDASAQVEVVPDLGVLRLAAIREGDDAAALSREVARLVNQALEQVRSTPGVEAATAYSTAIRYADTTGKRAGWIARGELTLKSRDTGALGRLAGQLTTHLQIVGSGAEISSEQRLREEVKLQDAAIAAFRARAEAAARAFGYRSVAVREVEVGSIGGDGPSPRMVMRMAAAPAPAEPVGIEMGRQTLRLQVHGAVQMLKSAAAGP